MSPMKFRLLQQLVFLHFVGSAAFKHHAAPDADVSATSGNGSTGGQEAMSGVSAVIDEMSSVTSREAAVEELAVALPIVLINLTYVSGILNDGGAVSPEISFHAGNMSRDLEFVTDRVAGYFAILGNYLGPEDKLQYCAPGVLQNIFRCVHIGVCAIESSVPAVTAIEVYSGLVEQVVRFEEVVWPNIRSALTHDQEGNLLGDDLGVPQKYACDDASTESLIQTASESSADLHVGTLAMSSALRSAMDDSHAILDSHQVNGSMDATIQKLQTTWHRVCEGLGCDHTNYWDIYLRHHQHSLALLDTQHTQILRKDIRQRVQLQQRVQKFIGSHADAYSFVQNYARFEEAQASSEAVMHSYFKRSREALLDLAKSVAESMPKKRAELFLAREALIKAEEEYRGSVTPSKVKRASIYEDEDENEEAPVNDGRDQSMSLVKEQEEDEGRVRAVRSGKGGKGGFWKALWAALKCFGHATRFLNTGYSRSIGGTLAWSVGLSSGASEPLMDLMKGTIPSAWISVGSGFAIGSTSQWYWSGVGLSGSVGCSTSAGCSLSVSLSGVVCGIAAQPWSPACPLPSWFTSPLGLKCGHSAGWSVSVMCCWFNLANGQNNCR